MTEEFEDIKVEEDERDKAEFWGQYSLTVSLGGDSDENGFIKIVFFGPEDGPECAFSIYFEGAHYAGNFFSGGNELCVEEMDMRVAEKIRDFLNYVLPVK